MPKPSQEGSRQRNSTPKRNQPSRSNSTDSQRTRTVRFQKNSNGGQRTNNRDNNWRGPNRQNTNSNRPNDNKNSSKDPANIVNAKIMPQMNAKRASSVERLDTSAMSSEVTLPTI